MQENEFKDLLGDRASSFTLKPSGDGFGKVMGKRNRQKRKRVFLFAAATLVALSSVALLFTRDHFKKENVRDTAERTALSQPGAVKKTAPVNESPLTESAVKEKIHPKNTINRKGNSQNAESASAAAGKNSRTETPVIAEAPENSVAARPVKPGNAQSAGIKAQKKRIRTGGSTDKTARSPGIPSDKNIIQPGAASHNMAVITPASPSPVPTLKEKAIPVVSITPPVITADSLPQVALVSAAPDTAPVSPLPEKSIAPVKYKKWAVAAWYTPRVVSSAYSANSSADLKWMKNYLNLRAENDKAFYSYETGIKLSFAFHRRFSLGAGVAYSTISFEELRLTNKINIKKSSRIVEMGDPGLVVIDQNRYDNSFSYIDLPLSVNWEIPVKKVRIQVSAGVTYSKLLKTRSLVFSAEDSINVKEVNDAGNNRLQQQIFSLNGGAYLAVPVYKNWSVYAGPVYRHNLSSLYSKAYVIRQRAAFVGCEAGVKFSF